MKTWWKSITLWFNAIAASIPVLLPLLAQELPTMKAYLPENIYGYLFLVVTVGNILIRVYLTRTAIQLIPPLVKP